MCLLGLYTITLLSPNWIFVDFLSFLKLLWMFISFDIGGQKVGIEWLIGGKMGTLMLKAPFTLIVWWFKAIFVDIFPLDISWPPKVKFYKTKQVVILSDKHLHLGATHPLTWCKRIAWTFEYRISLISSFSQNLTKSHTRWYRTRRSTNAIGIQA